MPDPKADDSDKDLSRRIRRYALILLIVQRTENIQFFLPCQMKIEGSPRIFIFRNILEYQFMKWQSHSILRQAHEIILIIFLHLIPVVFQQEEGFGDDFRNIVRFKRVFPATNLTIPDL